MTTSAPQIASAVYTVGFYSIVSDSEVLIDGRWVAAKSNTGHLTSHGYSADLAEAQAMLVRIAEHSEGRVYSISNDQPKRRRRQVNVRIVAVTESVLTTYTELT